MGTVMVMAMVWVAFCKGALCLCARFVDVGLGLEAWWWSGEGHRSYGEVK